MSKSAANFLIQEFCESFAAVFEQNSGAAYPLKTAANAPAVDDAESLSYALEVSGAVRGTFFVTADLASAAMLATRLMGGPDDPSAEITYLPEHEDALFEIVSQVAGVIATTLRTSFGSGDIQVSRKQSLAPVPALAVTLEAASGDKVIVRLLPEQALYDSLDAALGGGTSHATEPAHNAAAAASESSEHQNLRLIMDVELDLTLRFGQRTLTLSEVADLTTGSVVELDRVVDEPVELLIGDRVIARGEVVIVDGNYGLRITDLASDHHALLTA